MPKLSSHSPFLETRRSDAEETIWFPISFTLGLPFLCMLVCVSHVLSAHTECFRHKPSKTDLGHVLSACLGPTDERKTAYAYGSLKMRYVSGKHLFGHSGFLFVF